MLSGAATGDQYRLSACHPASGLPTGTVLNWLAGVSCLFETDIWMSHRPCDRMRLRGRTPPNESSLCFKSLQIFSPRPHSGHEAEMPSPGRRDSWHASSRFPKPPRREKRVDTARIRRLVAVSPKSQL